LELSRFPVFSWGFGSGGFFDPAAVVRSSDRYDITPGGRYSDLGLRPARAITAH
jgi:hypothetical protein